MRKLRCSRAVMCMFPVAATASCLSCIGNSKKNNFGGDDEFQDIKPLLPLKLKDLIAPTPTPTLAFHLKPKMVVMKVSIHCNGCARKVEKHLSKLEGVSSYKIDLETKMVVVRGDIVPSEVLESVSKVKYAELWES
ncbi:protein SODIUM POTASSIUM ROOT DEFECTIVE 1-like [Salvia splendens]|uniref:protein SODIUM POTASSIUM ROOT DEFECTIVE 1-like n=1 Tax=Salvia splendens TaxID=180675 RepID=UPI001C255518|nr:protein SODIUM POTASSIUM ROOT DEFECTIVE 1-like [Salvia splendens]